MTARTLRPVITLATVMGILLAVLAVYALLTAGAARADSTFHPTTTVKFCNDIESSFPPDPSLNGGGGTCDESAGLAAGGHPIITTALDIPKGDLNFSNIVTLAPNSETIAAGTSMPAGEKIGALHSDTTLGTFNGSCNFFIGVDFRFWNVALPNVASETGDDPRTADNIAWPRSPGEPNRFGRWAIGGTPAPGADNIIESPTGYADGTSTAIQGYPSFLLDAFDPDFVPGVGDTSTAVKPLVPLAVYGGLTKVVGDWIPLYLVQFSSGQLTGLTASPLSNITAAMGQPQVAVLQDPTVSAAPSDITDFCSRLDTTTMLLGVSSPGGVNRVTNPGAGTTQFFLQYFASERDTDQDSYENQIDTCPLDVNVGDPRWSPGPGAGVNDNTQDGKGIDYTCHPSGTPSPTPGPSITASPFPTPYIDDLDLDGYKNRLDNCPQVPNGVNTTATPGPTYTPDPSGTPVPTPTLGPTPFQKESEQANTAPAADNGPNTDGMGDLCDSGSITIQQNNRPVSITMSTVVGNGRYMTATNIVAKCIGGTDADKDGYCSGTDAFDATTGHNSARHTGWAGATHPALQMDSDKDKLSDVQETWMSQCIGPIATPVPTPPLATCAPFATSTPGPGFPGFTLGADAAHSCAQTIGIPGSVHNDEGPWDNWGYDLNDDGTITGGEFLNFAAPYGKTVDLGSVTVFGMGSVGIARFDFNNDGLVSGGDYLVLAPVYGKTCAQAGIPAFVQQ